MIQVAHASRVWTWDALALGVVSGTPCALAGVVIFPDLLLAPSVLTLLIAAALLVAGVLRAVVALRERPRQGWAEVLAAGVLGALAGVGMLQGWPVTGLSVLGLILAVDLIVQGATWPAFGLALGPRGASGRT